MITGHSGEKVRIFCGDLVLQGLLGVPRLAKGIVLFAHGSGSGRMSPRNNQVARHLQIHDFATLLIGTIFLTLVFWPSGF